MATSSLRIGGGGTDTNGAKPGVTIIQKNAIKNGADIILKLVQKLGVRNILLNAEKNGVITTLKNAEADFSMCFAKTLFLALRTFKLMLH